MFYDIMILLCFAAIMIELFMIDLVMFMIYLFRNLIMQLPNNSTLIPPSPGWGGALCSQLHTSCVILLQNIYVRHSRNQHQDYQSSETPLMGSCLHIFSLISTHACHGWKTNWPEPQIKTRHPVPFDYIRRVDPRDAHLFLPLQLKTRESTLALIPLRRRKKEVMHAPY